MARKQIDPFDWASWIKSFGVYFLTLLGGLIAFYFSTTSTLNKHDDQFKKLEAAFREFGDNSKTQFKEYMAFSKADAEKVERTAKEDRDARDKMREQFQGLISQLTTNTMASKIQLEAVVKQLDAVTAKIDNISTVQQENRVQRVRDDHRPNTFQQPERR